MAIKAPITADDHWFLGEDKTLLFAIDGTDVATYALSWMLKRTLYAEDADAVVTKTTASGIAVVGTYNGDPTLSTQRVQVTIADTDTDALAPRVYHHELKRTDASLETVLSYGPAVLQRGVHRA